MRFPLVAIPSLWTAKPYSEGVTYTSGKPTPEAVKVLLSVRKRAGGNLGNMRGSLIDEIEDGLIHGEVDVERYVEQVKMHRKMNAKLGAEGTRRVAPLWGQRAAAMRRLFAQEATDWDEVAAWRSRVLGEELLELGDLAAWVEGRAEEQGNCARYECRLEHPPAVPGSEAWGDYLPWAFDGPGEVVRVDIAVLSVGVPGGVCRVETEPCGQLDDLRLLAERLAKAYRWDRAQAAAFVLTGWPPPPSVVQFTAEPYRNAGPTVTIEAHAEADPAVVLRAFREARAQLVGPRVRPPSERASRLALFCAERPGKGWPSLFRAWQRTHAEETYADLRTFRRAAQAAVARVRYGPPHR